MSYTMSFVWLARTVLRRTSYDFVRLCHIVYDMVRFTYDIVYDVTYDVIRATGKSSILTYDIVRLDHIAYDIVRQHTILLLLSHTFAYVRIRHGIYGQFIYRILYWGWIVWCRIRCDVRYIVHDIYVYCIRFCMQHRIRYSILMYDIVSWHTMSYYGILTYEIVSLLDRMCDIVFWHTISYLDVRYRVMTYDIAYDIA